MKTIAFFSNKAGVGNTSLVYHLAWMFADHRIKTLVVDFDPQAVLTALFLERNRLENLWAGDEHPGTVLGTLQPILRGDGDIAKPNIEVIEKNIGLIVGDFGLSRFEGTLSAAWPRCKLCDESAFRTTTAFHRILRAGKAWGAEIALMDVGPNLGAINRSALIAADHLCLTTAPDISSLQALKILEPTLREWRNEWAELLPMGPRNLLMPEGLLQPAGTIVIQNNTGNNCQHDDLMLMAKDAHRPMFSLEAVASTSASHAEAARNYTTELQKIATEITKIAGIGF